jgi:sugar phosphate isomerase/epimerase
MKLGAVSTAVADVTLEVGLARLQSLGLETIEIFCAGYARWVDPEPLLANHELMKRWRSRFEDHELEISSLAVHGQPLSPDPAIAAAYKHEFEQACRFAEALGISRLNLLAGLPEGAAGDNTPCWITQPYPPANLDAYSWQWEQRVIPYWTEQAGVAERHGCRLCFEMHPGDVVYNPPTLLRLRQAVGSVVGANFDPSHLFFQGIDICEAVRMLGSAVYHVHAKDTRIQARAVRVTGTLDPTPYTERAERSWMYCTVGYGHGEEFWREFIATLRLIGYDDVISIEHEDESMTLEEGLTKAVRFLRPLIPREPAGAPFWSLPQGRGNLTDPKPDS